MLWLFPFTIIPEHRHATLRCITPCIPHVFFRSLTLTYAAPPAKSGPGSGVADVSSAAVPKHSLLLRSKRSPHLPERKTAASWSQLYSLIRFHSADSAMSSPLICISPPSSWIANWWCTRLSVERTRSAVIASPAEAPECPTSFRVMVLYTPSTYERSISIVIAPLPYLQNTLLFGDAS